MFKKFRFDQPGVSQHIIHFDEASDRCFRTETDYRRYIQELKAAASKSRCRIHAYTLMSHFVHLLVTPSEINGVQKMMKLLSSNYTAYINKKYQQKSIAWNGKYKSKLVVSEMYLLACMCYIELSPVRANLVRHPGRYQWSSYQQNMQLEEQSIINFHAVYMSLGSTNKERTFVYKELFQRHIDNDSMHKFRDVLTS